MTQQPSNTCANPHTQPILFFRSLFLLEEQKNNNEGYGRKWSGTQRRSGAETGDPPRARFICCYSLHRNARRAHAVGRVGVVAKRRLGVERNDNEACFRGTGGVSIPYSVPLTFENLNLSV